MALTQSFQEVQVQYIAVMGEELGSSFFQLHRRLIELHVVWQQYRQLFGHDAETVDLLNRTAGLFFKIVQDELWDSVLLGISRITDPSQTGGRKNLTIQSLAPLISDGKLRAEVLALTTTAVDQAAFAREHRNKRIAHHDHAYTSGLASTSLNGVSRERVETMLSSLRAAMNRLNVYFIDSTTFYEDFVDESGARVLVSKLAQFERLKAASRAP
jgi:hypothetical protein